MMKTYLITLERSTLERQTVSIEANNAAHAETLVLCAYQTPESWNPVHAEIKVIRTPCRLAIIHTHGVFFCTVSATAEEIATERHKCRAVRSFVHDGNPDRGLVRTVIDMDRDPAAKYIKENI